MARVLVIIPAFNESRTIGRVLDEVRTVPADLDIVVIDDGSTDHTADEVRKRGETVIPLPYNLGIGGAVQTGFRYALRKNYEAAVRIDSDGQHKPGEIPCLIDAMQRTGADVIIGSRFLGTAGYTTSPMRRMGVAVFTFINSMILRQRITDNTSGFQAFNRRAIRFLAENYPHDFPEPESIVLLSRNGFKIAEVPVCMREREHGQSSISRLHGPYYMIKVLLAIFVDLFKERIES